MTDVLQPPRRGLHVLPALMGLVLLTLPVAAGAQPYPPSYQQPMHDDDDPDDAPPPSYAPQPIQPYAPQYQQPQYAPPQYQQPYAQAPYPPADDRQVAYGASCDTGPQTSCALVRQAPVGARCTCPGYHDPTYGSVR